MPVSRMWNGSAWVDIGTPGAKGDKGDPGNSGWSPILSVVTDGERRVLMVTDWTGGAGTKPATGQYVSATGLTSTLASAIDIRGATGPSGGISTSSANTWTASQTFTNGVVTGWQPTDGNTPPSSYPLGITTQTIGSTATNGWPGGSGTHTVISIKTSVDRVMQFAAKNNSVATLEYFYFRVGHVGSMDAWSAWGRIMDSTTAEVVTGTKTFASGALLMRSADGTQTAEPYSDVNAPSSFEMTQGTTPTNPPAGEATLWTPDSKSLLMKAPDGTTTTIGPSSGGGGGQSITFAPGYTNTSPATPADGLTVFDRFRARHMLATVGTSGQDTSYQPAMFANRIAWSAAINANTAMSGIGVATSFVTANVARTVATTNFYTSMVRVHYPSTTTAGAGSGLRASTAQWHLSSTANKGGFFLVCRFGIGAVTATHRGFIGMNALTTALTPSVNPSTLVNQVGFGWDSGQTTMRIMHNDGTGTSTMVDLGANFPVNVANTWFYEARLFAPSGGGQTVRYSLTRLNDGLFTNGTITTDLPALDTLLNWHFWQGNGTTAAAIGMDLQSMYVETDN